ncbi:MAG TPA: CDP-diacylglycerol--glycerol-3-phosphate 3-phosphatidyltransferase [Candidatus Enterousia intestinigallinarum]|jgi:CDP-diacylglycerol--glycerol-3-phosphate 3-phosphatidyltransferase|uniref:CDP-diacylglycerol--glycerol-3-phosphate 3-phosphatidyltransferase n=1 Tax=Candidatus Enterousia intestinigallinarum TaxID=2840790 RepID=A0A9D1FGI1_9PROT|nr:CDP-diacylglycerol--glycerol-3-phosphate 3-phosphatidyltransferase [Candidatus Enterousia intestinigallinarum]
MKFFVNFLSAFRIAAAFAIIPTLMFGLYWTSFILFLLAAVSDWFDGFLARKYNVCTKLGGVMDHIGDKLLVVNTLIMLTVMMPVWFIVVPVILMIARELYISGLREFLGTQKIEMPVPKARFSMGKIKTTLQMIAIVAFLLMFAMATLMTTTNSSFVMWTINVLPYIGMWGTWLALVASLWSATQYTFTFAQKLKQIKK